VYIKSSTRQNSLLKVDDNFATLVEINTANQQNEAKFQFSFKISQIDALKENAFSVLITIRKPSTLVEPSIVPTDGSGSSSVLARSLIDNVLSHKIKLLNIDKKRSQDIIAIKTADITSVINNHIINVVKNGEDFINKGLEKTKIIVKNKKDNELTGNISMPLESSLINDSTVDQSQSERSLRLKILKDCSISPADVSLLTSKTITAFSSLTGISRKEDRVNKNQFLDQLLNLYTSEVTLDNPETKYETTVGQIFDEMVTVNTPITIYDFLSISTSLNVSFELLKTVLKRDGGKQTIVLDKIDKTINLSSYIGKLSNAYPPKVGLTFNDRETSLYVKQDKDKSNLDSSNKRLRIYRKTIDEDLKNSYEKLNFVSLENDSFKEFQKYSYSHRLGENSIYRISFENSCEFEDIVFKSPGKKISSKLIVIPRLVQEGINVLVINNSLPEVVAVRLLYRDATVKNKNFSSTNQIISFDPGVNSTDLTIKNLTPYHTYEVTTKLIFKNGIELISNYSSFLEYIPFFGDVNATITNLLVSEDVQFTVQATLLRDQIGLLNSLLAQTSATYDLAALLNRPADYDRFIAFNIIRYNMNTGHVDNLGVIGNGETFVDSQRSSQVSAFALRQGDKYKYVVYPLVRDPADIVKESIELKDQETRKTYKVNPRKHRHPLTLIKGSVITQSFLNKDPKQDMLYGSTGTSIQLDVTILKSMPKIQNFIAGFLDKKRLILSWNVVGDIATIDHFIVMKEINGVKSVVGKSHCFENSLSFIHELTNHDLGNVRFILNPIYQDYSSGALEASNYILIDNLD
jgi:hypothetical protein